MGEGVLGSYQATALAHGATIVARHTQATQPQQQRRPVHDDDHHQHLVEARVCPEHTI